jgi:hypothetical protein
MSGRRQDAGAAVAGLFTNSSVTGGLAGRPGRQAAPTGGRVRVGVELTDEQSVYLRGLSRPSRTNGPRTLGTKFVATGVLIAAIELLREVDVDMHGIAAGDEHEMVARARAGLLRAGQRSQEGGER